MSVSKDKHLRTWNLVTGRSAYVTHIKEDATIIKWSPSGDSYVLVIGNKIVLYRLATASLACTLELPKPVLAIQFLTENILIAGGEFEGLRVFDIEKQTCIQTISGHESRVKAIEIVHDPFCGQDSQHMIVFSVSSDGDLRAWSLNQENFKEEPSLIARYEMNGRPTCLTVSHPNKPSKKTRQLKESVATEEKSTQENNNERRQRQGSTGDEPTKKKVKKKKKGLSKKKKKQDEPVETPEDEAGDPTEEHEEQEEDEEQMQE